jgi:hypothetical protein
VQVVCVEIDDLLKAYYQNGGERNAPNGQMDRPFDPYFTLSESATSPSCDVEQQSNKKHR